MATAVITGGTKGIGFGLAQAFRSRGFDVVISGRTDASVADALGRLEEAPGSGRVVGRPTDGADAEQVQALWDQAVADLGRVDYWVNNAGVAHTVHRAVDLSPADTDEMVTSNMLGTIHGSQVALRGMTAQGGGKLFTMLGGGADGKVRPGMAVYGATKSGLKYFCDALIKESTGGPVLVGTLSPGLVVTEGMIREAHVMGADEWAKQRKVMNILCNHVEDVAPFLVDRMIAAEKHGTFIRRMSNLELAKRFSTGGRGRDVFTRYGL
jgi:NADP-dependent 3-hydroxy acid dehydrogenase YdfG